eukprot:scaffold11381_cov23-Tisochrysis_lutea.AAC.3
MHHLVECGAPADNDAPWCFRMHHLVECGAPAAMVLWFASSTIWSTCLYAWIMHVNTRAHKLPRGMHISEHCSRAFAQNVHRIHTLNVVCEGRCWH